MLLAAQRGIEELMGARVRALGPRPLPPAAFYAPRQRYRAEKLLAYLDQHVRPGTGCDYVIGMTARDISTTKGDIPDWGIFGLGAMPGPVAVVSTFRLRGPHVTRHQIAVRVVKVFNHELGHNLGLDHCPTSGCLLQDARGSIRTVDSETGLPCAACRSRLRQVRGLAPPAKDSIDWDALLKDVR